MTSIKNELFFLLYAIQSLIHLVKVILFRAYLLLLFAMRPGGAFVIGAAVGGAFWALKHMETNLLSLLPEWVFEPIRQFRDAVLHSELLLDIYVPSFDYGYEVVAGLIGLAMFLTIRVTARIIAPVVFAFPMPRRPLAPVLRWIPPEHKIHAVKATIAGSHRRNIPWNGDWEKITTRLPDPLQDIIESPGTHTGLPTAHSDMVPVQAFTPAQSAPQANAASSAPSAPQSAPRGRFIPPEGQGGQSTTGP